MNARALRLLGGQVLSKAYYGANYEKGDLDYLSDLHLQPLGAGPFRFVQYLPGQEIRYEANEHYNTFDLVKNLLPSGPSRENIPPRPGTTSMIICVSMMLPYPKHI